MAQNASPQDAQNTYGPYAAVYNRLWGPQLPDLILPALDRLLLEHVPANAQLLDLCCGTGQITEALSTRGYRMTGIDICPQMLAFAERNAPSCRLLEGDATQFEEPQMYHGVLSTSDSVNHIITSEGVRAMFTNVYNALLPGGLFLFDVLLAENYQPGDGAPDTKVSDDHVIITWEQFDEDTQLSWCEMILFYREEGAEDWRRWDSRSAERFYDRAELEEFLSDTGFADIRFYDRANDLGMGEWGRTYVVARRPD